MMKSYRSDAARTRAGSLVAAALVGGGLLLTASGGIAAETSKKVQAEVRDVLAPVVPSLVPAALPEPIAPLATPAAVPPVAGDQLAMAGHPHPGTPVPPVPPVAAVSPAPPVPATPPVPPAPSVHRVHVDVDHDDIGREVREAMAEARRDIAEAQREAREEAMEARREALREAAEARREAAEARREGEQARASAARARAAAQVQVARLKCAQGIHRVDVEIDDGQKTHNVRCSGWSKEDAAQMRRTMLAGLQSARASIASIDARYIPDHARSEALRSLDSQIARLREGK